MSTPNTETPKTQVCQYELKKLGKTVKQARKPIKSFSPLKKGGYSQICKGCRCILSKEWTTKRADYRRSYQSALQMNAKRVAEGLKPNVRVPTAKTWKAGDPLRFVNGTAIKGTAATV